MFKISIIIVTYNSEKYISKCIKSLYLYSKYIQEIILIDNASTDNSVNIINNLSKIFAKIKITSNKENVGFTKGCNQGGKISKCKYLLFLNPDTTLIKFPIKQLQRFLNSHHNTGLIGFKFLNSDGSLQCSKGRFPNLINIICDRLPILSKYFGMQDRNPNNYKKICKTDWVSGSGLLINKDLWKKVAGFDENIFMYGEDIELAKRVERIGYKNYYFPNIIFKHVDSGKNIKERNPHKYFSMRKGILYFLRKHNKPIDYFVIFYLTKIEAYTRLIFMVFSGRSKKDKNLWQKYLEKTISL